MVSKIRGRIVVKKFIGLIGLVALAGAAQAAQVTVGGALAVGPVGSVGPVGLNATSTQSGFDASAGGVTIDGLLTPDAVAGANNNVTGNVQFLGLTLTNFKLTFTGQGSRTVTVRITQDYVLEPGSVNATGSNTINGSVDFSGTGQSISITAQSVHNATNIPVNNVAVNASGAGNQLFNGGTASVPVGLTGNIYRIDTLYTFTINSNGGTVTINLPDSAVDNAVLAVVPLPTAAWAGLGGLALAGAGVAVRRRRLAQ